MELWKDNEQRRLRKGIYLVTFYLTILLSIFVITSWQGEKPAQAVEPTGPRAGYSETNPIKKIDIPTAAVNMHLTAKKEIQRERKIKLVRNFMVKYNAPLQRNARDFVEAAEYYNIDWRLLPAIAMVESSGGKHLFKPYNPFGWGKWGYRNFREAIYDVSRGIAHGYYAKGAITPYQIAPSYNPVTPHEWGPKVDSLMKQVNSTR